MTHPAAVGLGALAARSASPNPAARKPQADFGAAFERAEQVGHAYGQERGTRAHGAPAREHATERAERAEARADAREAREAEPKDQAAPADEAAAAPQPEAPVEDRPVDATAEADAAAEQAAAEHAAADAAAQAAAEPALSPEAALALMIATGVPAGPAAAATPAEQAVAAVGDAAAGATAQADELAAMVAATKPAATGEAPAKAAGPQAATTTVGAPGSLAEATDGLGLTGIQVTTTAAAHAEVGPTNLGILLDEAAAEAAALEAPVTGAISPVPASDEAEGLEMLAPAALQAGEDEVVATAVEADAEPAINPLLNGDRQAPEAARGPGHAAKAEEPVRAQDVLPQIAKHAEALKAQQQNSIKLQLFPEHLGKMEIKVVSHQGVLSAQLTADSQHVKGMLETQVAQLQKTFQELGLKVDKVEVTLSSQHAGGFDMSQSAFQDQARQGFGQQPHAPRGTAVGYDAWLGGDLVADEAGAYAVPETITAIDYVA